MQMTCHELNLVAQGLGYLVLLVVAYRVVSLVWRRLLRPAADLKKYGARNGAWAVVTGASDGIGKAYAIELAKRGFNILLISRTESKLNEVAKELGQKYQAQTAVVAVDMGSDDPQVYATISTAVKKLGTVGILVNNVGQSYDYPMKYLDLTKEAEDKLIQMNIKTLSEMTRIVLPIMVEQKSGAIINLSSFAGTIPTPLLGVYSGCKAYVDYFSVSLAYEYKRDGIDIQSVTPGLVVSNMSKIRKASFMAGVCNPDVIAKGSLNDLGLQVRSNPFSMHAIVNWVVHTAPFNVIMNKILAANIATSKRALSKLKAAASTTSGNDNKKKK